MICHNNFRKLGDRPWGRDGKWVYIVVFSKISKWKLGDRPPDLGEMRVLQPLDFISRVAAP